MNSKVLIFVALFTLCGLVAGHTYKSGECPQVEPMQGFDMKKVTHNSFHLRIVFNYGINWRYPLFSVKSESGILRNVQFSLIKENYF